MISEQCIPEGYKQTEVGVIPEDWSFVTLDDAANFLDGQRRPIKSGDRAKIKGQYPYYGASGIVDYVNNYIFDGDFILLGEDGENILSRSLPLAFKASGKIWVNNHAHVMTPKASFHIDFLIPYLESLDYSLLNSGTAQPKLNKQSCLRINVIKPSHEEQIAIANALSDVDTLLSELEKLIAKKQDIKTAAMQQLLTGKTRLPQFATYTDGDKQGQVKGSKPSGLGEIPKDWEVVVLGDLANFCKGKGLPKSEISDFGMFDCIHYGELFTTYGPEIQSIQSATNSVEGTIKSEVNDILMPTSDVTPTGLATASGIKKKGVILGGDILIIRSHKDKLDSSFFSYLVTISKKQIMQLVTGSTVYHLYGSDMATFKFSCPNDIEEQTAIATILSDMDKEIQALQQRLSKTRQIKQGMMQELLTGKTRLVQPLNKE